MSELTPPLPQNFESSLEQLQLAVKRLEGGELSLEQALQQFEQGVRLTRVCQEKLAAAEQRVELLLKGTGETSPPETQPFAPAGR